VGAIGSKFPLQQNCGSIDDNSAAVTREPLGCRLVVGKPLRVSQERGIPDWYSRRRLVNAGPVETIWTCLVGAGVSVTRVEVALDGIWREAKLGPSAG
jgi:hypothetical protein